MTNFSPRALYASLGGQRNSISKTTHMPFCFARELNPSSRSADLKRLDCAADLVGSTRMCVARAADFFVNQVQ